MVLGGCVVLGHVLEVLIVVGEKLGAEGLSLMRVGLGGGVC